METVRNAWAALVALISRRRDRERRLVRNVICWATYDPSEFSFGCNVTIIGLLPGVDVFVGPLSMGIYWDPKETD